MVFVNGDFLAQRPNGYSCFSVRVDPYIHFGGQNDIRVEARVHQDSRWYTGGGIFRDTHIILADPVHVALDGVRVTTPDVDAERAIVCVATTVENDTSTVRRVRVITRILDGDNTEITRWSAPVTVLPGGPEVCRARLTVPDPSLWGPDHPNLYVLHTLIVEDASDRATDLLDEDRTTFGIRSLQLDSQHGLRVNGERVLLRGACIHHDTGPLGAAAIARAEERRVEILKQAGFNAIRSAHNPVSKATLDACDRLGILVVDELCDTWTQAKTALDYSIAFPEWWERDIDAMVSKDFNHPSVIMYSIGNEVPEIGRTTGSSWARRLAERLRALDGSRYITSAINVVAAMWDRFGEVAVEAGNDPNHTDGLIAWFTQIADEITISEEATAVIEESAAVLDVLGLNYADVRYDLEHDRYPDRIILGSETFPGQIDVLWALAKESPHILGDFCWTGWDYLGESGLARVEPADSPNAAATGVYGPYPYLTASCFVIDITGHRRPLSYYRETVYGLRQEPYIAVHRPRPLERPMTQSPYGWTDSLASWSWDVITGTIVTVDVYSNADEVELLLNGRSMARSAVGTDRAHLARFEVPYEVGELCAIAYLSSEEQARTILHSAVDPVRLALMSDRHTLVAGDTDLAFVTITLEDDQGNVANHRDRRISVTVEGGGILAGLGTGRPCTEEMFGASECTTYDGRALAVVRPTSAGEIEVTVSADGCEPVALVLTAD
jgi:hypothetical protein